MWNLTTTLSILGAILFGAVSAHGQCLDSVRSPGNIACFTDVFLVFSEYPEDLDEEEAMKSGWNFSSAADSRSVALPSPVLARRGRERRLALFGGHFSAVRRSGARRRPLQAQLLFCTVSPVLLVNRNLATSNRRDPMTGTKTPDRWRCTAAIFALLAAPSLPLALQAQSEPTALDFKVDIRGQEPAPRFLEPRVASDVAPLWVSAEAATKPDGMVDWELLGEDARRNFRNLERQPPMSFTTFQHVRELGALIERTNPDGTTTTIYHYGVSSKESPGDTWRSLEEVARDARAVFLGTVSGVSEGFFDGAVGSLLTVRVEDVLLGSDRHEVESKAYVYYPEARFSIGGLNFWKTNPTYPPRPDVGDRILLATDGRFPPDAEHLTILPHPGGLFLQP